MNISLIIINMLRLILRAKGYGSCRDEYLLTIAVPDNLLN